MFKTLKGYKQNYLLKDLFSGLIIAAVSIPISMGYALVAGLPAVYGLYGSVFPILCFALLSTSPQFIFGVDAAPAAMVGSLLSTMGIEAYSKQAIETVPVVTFFTACWLLLFGLLKFGKAVNFISVPVMGGFISGIGFTIILMQVPKLFGGTAGNGELPELCRHLVQEAQSSFNGLSLLLGLVTLVIIRVFKRIVPKFPMPVVMMALGAVLTLVFHVDAQGVQLLSAVEKGLPHFALPHFAGTDLSQCIGMSLTVAVVIMAETLLSENNLAMKNGYRIDDNRELFAYAAGNFAAAFTGCCPINGSVSRSSMNDQFGGKTQLTSLIAGVVMVFVLLFATDFIAYLPVPVLTAIVISALMSVIEVDLAKRLYQLKKTEFFIFVAAFLGVVFLGTIYGVIIGVILSFADVLLRAVKPTTAFLGVIPGRKGFFSLKRNKNAYPIRGALIYRFSSDLFFANIQTFQDELEQAVTADTKAIIVDAVGINSIDVTAADRLDAMCRNFDKQDIRFYITEHTGELNDQMRKLGIGHFIEAGHVRRTVTAALRDSGYAHPYPLVDAAVHAEQIIDREEENSLQEFVWAFGEDAEEQMERHAQQILQHFKTDAEEEIHLIQNAEHWGALGSLDEDDLINRLELHIAEIADALGKDELEVEQAFEEHRHRIQQRLKIRNPEAYAKLKEHRREAEAHLQAENPEAYAHLQNVRRLKIKRLRQRLERLEQTERETVKQDAE